MRPLRRPAALASTHRRRHRDVRGCAIVVEDMAGEDLSDAVLAGQAWQRRRFERCRFVEADLRKLRTSGCVFVACDFTLADLERSEHTGTAFRSCIFRRTTIAHARMDGCSLLGSMFSEYRLRPLTLTDTDLTLVGFAGADLRRAVLAGLRMVEANLSDADLCEADLRGADLRGARMLATQLRGA